MWSLVNSYLYQYYYCSFCELWKSCTNIISCFLYSYLCCYMYVLKHYSNKDSKYWPKSYFYEFRSLFYTLLSFMFLCKLWDCYPSYFFVNFSTFLFNFFLHHFSWTSWDLDLKNRGSRLSSEMTHTAIIYFDNSITQEE